MSPETILQSHPALQIAWQKRQSVVLFADVVGFFQMARQTPLEELGQSIGQLYGFWGAEIRRQRGEVISYIGDSVLAVFNKESCGTMDPEWCATLTAFHLVKGTKKLRPEMELSVGLHFGEILEGSWEEAGRVMRTVLGDTVNKAALLVAGKLRGIHATPPLVEILGPRVAKEKLTLRFPGGTEDTTVFRLNSLVL